MALIDEVTIVVRNELPEHASIGQIRRALADALWDAIEDQAEKRVRVHIWNATATPRVRELHDVFTFLLGPRKPD